jgi:hypothetical protein
MLLARPNLLHEAVTLFHQHLYRRVAVRTTEVPDLAFTRAGTIHILIPHLKCRRGEVNLLWEIGEQLVVEALRPVSVRAQRYVPTLVFFTTTTHRLPPLANKYHYYKA